MEPGVWLGHSRRGQSRLLPELCQNPRLLALSALSFPLLGPARLFPTPGPLHMLYQPTRFTHLIFWGWFLVIIQAFPQFRVNSNPHPVFSYISLCLFSPLWSSPPLIIRSFVYFSLDCCLSLLLGSELHENRQLKSVIPHFVPSVWTVPGTW